MVGVASVEAAAGRLKRAERLIGFAEGLAEMLGGEFDPIERRLHAARSRRRAPSSARTRSRLNGRQAGP